MTSVPMRRTMWLGKGSCPAVLKRGLYSMVNANVGIYFLSRRHSVRQRWCTSQPMAHEGCSALNAHYPAGHRARGLPCAALALIAATVVHSQSRGIPV